MDTAHPANSHKSLPRLEQHGKINFVYIFIFPRQEKVDSGALSLLPLKLWLGIMNASSAISAKYPWWGKDSFRFYCFTFKSKQ